VILLIASGNDDEIYRANKNIEVLPGQGSISEVLLYLMV
jgi:hypothetical protein